MRLADRLAATDRPRAIAAIGRAFALLETDARISDYSRGSLAAVGVVYASRVGHPDLAGLRDFAVASRLSESSLFPGDSRDDGLVTIAAALALVDPPAARRVLAGVAPPGLYAERALTKRRDWLFALALADPDRAVQLVDQLIARSEKVPAGGGSGFSATGLSELGSLLTARDTLDRLAHWGDLPHETRDYPVE